MSKPMYYRDLAMYLRTYASGSGRIDFVMEDLKGNATGEKPTHNMMLDYLISNPHFLVQGYRLGYLNYPNQKDTVFLYRPYAEVDSLSPAGRKQVIDIINDGVYEYEFMPSSDSIRVWTYLYKVKIEVVNLSIKSSLLFWLKNKSDIVPYMSYQDLVAACRI